VPDPDLLETVLLPSSRMPSAWHSVDMMRPYRDEVLPELRRSGR
jgi:hypothetical protein